MLLSNTMRRTLLCGIGGMVLSSAALHSAPLVIEGKDGWLFPIWESASDIDKPGIDAHVAAIAFLKEQLATRKIVLMTMVVPMKASFYPDRLPAAKPVSAEVMQRYAYVMTQLQAAGILTFDDLSVLRATEKAPATAFFRTDYHWTAQGAEASADAAAELIRKEVRFETAPAGGSKLGEWVNVRRYGDLATRFMTAEQRTTLGRDVFSVRAPPKEKQSLLDEEPAEIHVVGNSFVQPYLGFPQKLSQNLNRPVSLTWKPGNVGPWVTVLQYLESDDYVQTKPRVVFLQLNEPRMYAGPDAKDAWDAESIMTYAAWRDRVKAAVAK